MVESLDIFKKDPESLEKCIEEDIKFHQTLIDATENPIFKIITQAIMKYLKYSRQITIKQFGVEKVTKEHEAILEAVRRKDSQSAVNNMKQHMASALNDIKRISKIKSS